MKCTNIYLQWTFSVKFLWVAMVHKNLHKKIQDENFPHYRVLHSYLRCFNLILFFSDLGGQFFPPPPKPERKLQYLSRNVHWCMWSNLLKQDDIHSFLPAILVSIDTNLKCSRNIKSNCNGLSWNLLKFLYLVNQNNAGTKLDESKFDESKSFACIIFGLQVTMYEKFIRLHLTQFLWASSKCECSMFCLVLNGVFKIGAGGWMLVSVFQLLAFLHKYMYNECMPG